MGKRYALKGINDDQHECCVCGKVELKRVMWIVELDADGNEISEAFHCGTTCGAKLLGYTHSVVLTKVKNYQSEVSRRRDNLYYWKQNELGRERILQQLTGLSFTERKAHPLWPELARIADEAREWADTQEIVIEL